jgi:D-alanyl-D-alanine carboxypeptidase/D-alanyl-D-alanine-endopeptidase (penicillin-binding protein 4)
MSKRDDKDRSMAATHHFPVTTLGKLAMLMCWLLSVSVLVSPPQLRAEPQPGAGVAPLLINGGYIVDDGSGNHRYREHELFVPASTIKILTCLVALEQLGADHRFATHFFLDRGDVLYIKGYGDPLLTSEVVLSIAKTLAAMGVRRLTSIRLDDSAFALGEETASEENSSYSYDAPNGALAVNFNAVMLTVGKKGKVSTVEGQTPFLPMMRQMAIGLSPGSYRQNVASLAASSEKPAQLRYVAELFTAQLRAAGIDVTGPWQKQHSPAGLRPILVHQSPMTLAEMVHDCLKYSNNFIANQLFLAVGADRFGHPATWEKGRKALSSYAATTLHLGEQQLVIREGSGLSRHNLISAAAFIPILEKFKPYAGLLSEKDNIPLKSGTLTGVYCFAGYFIRGETLVPFAILLNQTENTRKSLLQELQKAMGVASDKS